MNFPKLAHDDHNVVLSFVNIHTIELHTSKNIERDRWYCTSLNNAMILLPPNQPSNSSNQGLDVTLISFF
jgi:hypothetical protein